MRSVVLLKDGSIALSFMDSSNMGRIRLQADGNFNFTIKSSGKEAGGGGGGNRYFSNTNLAEAGRLAAMRKKGDGRQGGRVAINGVSSLAIMWWPRPSPDAFFSNNVILYTIRLVEGWEPQQVASLPTMAEVLGVYWGSESTPMLYILTVDKSKDYDSVLTLKKYEAVASATQHSSQAFRRKNDAGARRASYFNRQNVCPVTFTQAAAL